MIHIENRKKLATLSSRQACFVMNESVAFFYFQYVSVNWIYKSRVALLEQRNVL